AERIAFGSTPSRSVLPRCSSNAQFVASLRAAPDTSRSPITRDHCTGLIGPAAAGRTIGADAGAPPAAGLEADVAAPADRAPPEAPCACAAGRNASMRTRVI